MSYDLALFRVPDGIDPDAAYSAIMDSEEAGDARDTPSDATQADMRRIANALKAWRPSLQEATSESWIELNDDALQLQFIVYEMYVAVSMPFFRDRAAEMIDTVFGAVETLRDAAQYSAFDPQLGRAITRADADELLRIYRETDSVLPELLAQSPAKPWWKFW